MSRASKWLKALFQPTNPADVPVTIKLTATQSANALEIQDSGGNPLAYFDPSGKLIVPDATFTATELDPTTIQYAEVALTNGEIKALRATPKTLVAAPGAGKVIEFVSAAVLLDYGSEAMTETVDDMAVKYKDGAGAAASGTIEATGFIDATADTVTVALPTSAQSAAAGCENQPLVLHNTGDGEYGGNATGDTVMRVKVAYRVHATGF